MFDVVLQYDIKVAEQSSTGTTPFKTVSEGVGTMLKERVGEELIAKMLPELPYAVFDANRMLMRVAWLLPSIRITPPWCVVVQAFLHLKKKTRGHTKINKKEGKNYIYYVHVK